MGTRISTPARNAIVDAVKTLLDAGAAAAKGKFYTGTQPAGPGTSASGTLLATATLSDPSFPAASSGSASTDPASVNASASGTAGYLRLEDSDGNGVVDLPCGTSVAVSGTASTDVLTTSGAHGLAVGQLVYFAAGITGLAAGAYVVLTVPTSTTFTVGTYGSTSPVNITADTSASFCIAPVAMSTTALVSGNPVDITGITLSIGAGA